MASITLRHPSSDMAATYLTSGENTKSGSMCQTNYRLRFSQRHGHLTNDLSMRDSPMAHGILGYLFLLLLRLIGMISRHNWMPRRHRDDNTVCRIPLMSIIGRRNKCAIFTFLVICNDGTIGVRDEEEGWRGGNPADGGTWRVGYAPLVIE